MASTVRSKTMLVSLSISRWGNRKQDKTAAAKIAKQSNVAPGRINASKKLVDPALLKPINIIYTLATQYHYASTLPWQNQGVRIIPTRKFLEWSTEMKGLKADFERAVFTFTETYDKKIKEAEESLGDLFNRDDYPTTERLKDKYSFSTSMSQVPASADFRVDLPQEAIDEIRAKMEVDQLNAHDIAKKELWGRIDATVSDLYQILINEDARVHNTTVNTKITSLLEQLTDLNYDDDPKIRDMHTLISAKLKGLSRDQIKESKTYRDQATKNAEDIFERMKFLMNN